MNSWVCHCHLLKWPIKCCDVCLYLQTYSILADQRSTHPHIVLYPMCADWEELSLTNILVHVACLNVWLGCKERGHGLCEEQQLLQPWSQNKIGGITRPAFERVMRHLSLLSLLLVSFC